MKNFYKNINTVLVLVLTLSIAILFLTACGSETNVVKNTNANDALNSNIEYPKNSYKKDSMAVDNSITIIPKGNENVAMPMHSGDTMNVTIDFSAPNKNIVAAGMRFGPNGPVTVVPINNMIGKSSGTLSFPIVVTPKICAELSNICHSIKCYEFAVTDIGTLSKANIRDVVMACNDCQNQSCKDLLKGECDDLYLEYSVSNGKGCKMSMSLPLDTNKLGYFTATAITNNRLQISNVLSFNKNNCNDYIFIDLSQFKNKARYTIDQNDPNAILGYYDGKNNYDHNLNTNKISGLGGYVEVTKYIDKFGIGNEIEGSFNINVADEHYNSTKGEYEIEKLNISGKFRYKWGN